MKAPRIAVLGAGSWGTTVGAIASRSSPTIVWARDPSAAREIAECRTNERYLPGASLPRGLRATSDLAEAVERADVLVAGVPSQGLRSVLRNVAPILRPWVPVVSLVKGLERGTHKTMTQVVAEELPGHPAGALSGPNIAKEVASGMAAAATLAMPDQGLAAQLADLFRTDKFRIYSSNDVVGVEMAGACKNVYAIAVGMADGAQAGANTKAMVMTRSGREMARLGEALGGRRETFAGLAGMGDLIVTCTSPHSRNRHVGEGLGQGRALADVLAGMSQVAEGVTTTPVVVELAEQVGICVPIAREVLGVVEQGRTVKDAYRGLLRSAPGHETEGDGW
ncbi:NAD(P)H-dependent glycerol-3-phosphate dehydrogenase [Nocardioides immobilis]|uniref:Glycerol-3-phosphate dehydrogenase [NAD(P)+] n=1 Tax=Nocardioides immobilis TaxID=2049295 RepID=A0A417Y7U2_9ACTN|nr:NAD(P)H-dependent glycerol-3-phosphate dehydrogenase [Nocardioides immobilis]RHW28536.1 NAD(P)H-dependent glycerol-3-phosphate dehydrogenase [Nocardioides immobilis]